MTKLTSELVCHGGIQVNERLSITSLISTYPIVRLIIECWNSYSMTGLTSRLSLSGWHSDCWVSNWEALITALVDTHPMIRPAIECWSSYSITGLASKLICQGSTQIGEYLLIISLDSMNLIVRTTTERWISYSMTGITSKLVLPGWHSD